VTFVLHPQVNADVLALDHVERIHAVRALKALKAGDVTDYTVDVLGPSRALLQLDGLMALKCGDAATSPLRIVFDRQGDDTIVLAVGRRQRSAVFQDAHYRYHPVAQPRLRLRTHSAADWHQKGLMT
jgi:hypothetical protein